LPPDAISLSVKKVRLTDPFRSFSPFIPNFQNRSESEFRYGVEMLSEGSGVYGLAGRFLIRPVFRLIASTGLREVFTATALLLVIGVALAVKAASLSPALGTFVAGVVLADSEYRHELESDIEPFKGLLLGLFFIAVGGGINFSLLFQSPLLIVGLVLALAIVKFLVLLGLGRFFKLAWDQSLLFAFALAQGGEFAFVLFSFTTQNKILTLQIAEPLVVVVALSMVLTPVLMIIYERLVQPRFQSQALERENDDIDETENPVIIAGFGRFLPFLPRSR
jgi:Kef-type K+ transport system membrane component KefB